MTMRISPIIAQLGRLSIGSGSSSSSSSCTVSRTSIRLAHAGRTPKSKKRKGPRIEPSYAPGHGEKIFVFNHFLDGMTVYSHNPVLKANHAFRQLPFNGKKRRPSKLRKDYWRPLALIQFPEGQGEVGRSVFQRLRECKKLHEYSWDDSLLFGETKRTLTRRERGHALNDQRANTIADMAAVLGGLGKGNRILLGDVAPPVAAALTGEESELTAMDEGKALVRATVWWADALDRNYAKKWTKNVQHELFEEAVLEPITARVTGRSVGGEAGEAQSVPAELVAEQELTNGAEQSQKL